MSLAPARCAVGGEGRARRFALTASVPRVVFPLMPNRACDNVVGDDLKQDDVARATVWNGQFARAPTEQFRTTA